MRGVFVLALVALKAASTVSAFPTFSSSNGTAVLTSAFGGDVVLAPDAAGTVVARSLLSAEGGISFNATRLDETLLSELGSVLSGLVETQTAQAASLASLTTMIGDVQDNLAAALANATARISLTVDTFSSLLTMLAQSQGVTQDQLSQLTTAVTNMGSPQPPNGGNPPLHSPPQPNPSETAPPQSQTGPESAPSPPPYTPPSLSPPPLPSPPPTAPDWLTGAALCGSTSCFSQGLVKVLCFSTSIHGWNASSWHGRCNNRGPTLTVYTLGTPGDDSNTTAVIAASLSQSWSSQNDWIRADYNARIYNVDAQFIVNPYYAWNDLAAMDNANLGPCMGWSDRGFGINVNSQMRVVECNNGVYANDIHPATFSSPFGLCTHNPTTVSIETFFWAHASPPPAPPVPSSLPPAS
jgi:TLD